MLKTFVKPCPAPSHPFSLSAMPRRQVRVEISPSVIARLQRRRAGGATLAALAAELGIAPGTLKRFLRARPSNSAGDLPTPPKAVAKAQRSSSVPIKKRRAWGPAIPESKERLRAMLAEAVRNTQSG